MSIPIFTEEDEQSKYFAYSSTEFEEVLVGKNHDEIIIQFVSQISYQTITSEVYLRLLKDGFDPQSYSADTPSVASFLFDCHDGLSYGTLELSIGGKRARWKKYPGYNDINYGKLMLLILRKDGSYEFRYSDQLLGKGILREDFKYIDDDTPDGNLVGVQEEFDIFTTPVSGIGIDGVGKGNGYIMFGYLLVADSFPDSEKHIEWIKDALNRQKEKEQAFEEYRQQFMSQIAKRREVVEDL